MEEAAGRPIHKLEAARCFGCHTTGTPDAPEPGLRTHIEAALEGKAVRLAKIETSFASQASYNGVNPAPVSLDELERLQPEDIFQRLYRSKYQSESPLALTTAFAELLQHVEETATP